MHSKVRNAFLHPLNAAFAKLLPLVEGSLWFFVPNKGAAIFFSIGYLASTLIHLWQCR